MSAPSAEALHAVRSPWSGEIVGRVRWGGADDAQAAVDAAAGALAAGEWPLHQRAAALVRAAELVERHGDDLARSICAEAGKPIKLARVEASRAGGTLLAAAEAGRGLAGEMVPLGGTAGGAGKLAFTLRVPVGVVAAITPFNFPLNLAVHKVAPALAAGCPIVLKPAEKTPLTAALLVDLLRDAGVPAGWLNLVIGEPGEIVDRLLADDRVRLVTFTGSSRIGWDIRARAPRRKVLLELGNSTPAIVAADADLDVAAERLAASAFAFAGQACISVQRIYVQRPALEPFLERFRARADALVVGDPADERTDVGPVITEEAAARILASVRGAVEAGARVVTGGDAEGALVRPTILTGVDAAMDVCRREIFGPVAVVAGFDDLEEAIAACNATPYGLQAGIFTASLDDALTAAQRLEFGGVTINEAPSFRADGAPYGGHKESGNTKEGPAYAIREMTEERLVVVELRGCAG
jgi:acyl-CoA reductase-like NAD-dependent aldehyde dehydrogenase